MVHLPDRHGFSTRVPEFAARTPMRHTAPKSKPVQVNCPYCGEPAELVWSSEIYGRSAPSYGRMWACLPCEAWVGCHKNSKRHIPLGRLANAELRKAKQEAHAAFDRLWQAKMHHHECSKGEARAKAYAWLAEQMGIEGTACHIGMFDVAECRRVVEICGPIGRKPQ